MSKPKCRSCGYELVHAGEMSPDYPVYDWGHEADCLARKLAATESKLPRWRNPLDELPPLTEKVLGFWATNIEKGIPGGYMLVRYEEVGKGGAPRWFDDCDDDPGPPPDLWMPLPEPPK